MGAELTLIVERTANGWGDLQTLLFDGTWNDGIGRFRSTFAFRGMEDSSFGLSTSLMRIGGGRRVKSDILGVLEQQLVKQFKKYARGVSYSDDKDWHWLSVAQHYGLPTRLLDWTYSPSIATHFAVGGSPKSDCDGVIWRVDYAAVHQALPHKYTEALRLISAGVFTVDMLERTLDNLAELSSMSALGKDYAFFFEPPSMDERIINQFAYFSMLSSHSRSLDDWLAHDPGLAEIARKRTEPIALKLIIPRALKWEIRDKLDQSNTTERVLFPGLSGTADWLKRHYRPMKDSAFE